MRTRIISTISFALCLLLAGQGAWAGLTQEEVSRLGKDLTPLGAEKAGNKDGTIPAWDGGITSPPAGWSKGQKYVHPYKDEKPLFTITASNVGQYADKLSAGHKEMFKLYPEYRMDVYPSHRSAAYPRYIYDQTIANAGKASLTDDRNGVVDALGAIPFPIPKNGSEVLWNSILRPFLSFKDRKWSCAPVTQDGSYTLTKANDAATVVYWAPGMTASNLNNILWKYKKTLTAPPRTAGQVLLVHETINQSDDARKAWIYNPGQRRVRRAPEYAFDNPWEGSDGLMTIDENVGFNGSPERYNWKLVGKQEMYIPYNAYHVVDGSFTYDKLLTAKYPNPDAMRYELHRVWVVEGMLKDGQRHVYKKRVLYIDEDSLTPLVMDQYDNRDQLWRMGEVVNLTFYDIPFMNYATEFHYDLQSGRYVGNFMNAEEPAWEFTTDLVSDREFTTQALRASGRR